MLTVRPWTCHPNILIISNLNNLETLIQKLFCFVQPKVPLRPRSPLIRWWLFQSGALKSGSEMCHQNSCVHSPEEEASVAEESLMIYCKPVELYNILHRRSLKNPSFLQRCLGYRRQAKGQERLRMIISLSDAMTEGMTDINLSSFYLLVTKPESNPERLGEQDSANYFLSRACKFVLSEGGGEVKASVILPEINVLSRSVNARKLALLLVSCAVNGGCCLLGKIEMESICLSLKRFVSLTMGHRTEMLLNADLHSCTLEPCEFKEGKTLTFNFPKNSTTEQIRATISVSEVGSDKRSAYGSKYTNISASRYSNIIRLRAGNVIFNYRDLNNMLRKTEVTEEFSCPFCLLPCMCFKGLRYHLISSHDLFNFEFWVSEEYQAVNVSVKIDNLITESVADEIDPRLETFTFCSKSRKRRRPTVSAENGKHVHPLRLDSSSIDLLRGGMSNGLQENANGVKDSGRLRYSCDLGFQRTETENIECTDRDGSGFNLNSVSFAMTQLIDFESAQLESGSDPVFPVTAPCTKLRKLCSERSEPRQRALLQRRQFYHSHRAQPMAMDDVLTDRDSEDEVDDDIADLEDRRMLDDFVDVSKDEKQFMHLWNSFVRKQKVLADGHVPWACEAFSKLHGQELVRAPTLFWCWRLFMIKLWNHGLLDPRTMNNCYLTLEEYRKQS
uniref:Embryonic flower 2 n=2 Tax=Kalanchoe fedtschenkoi TaxID=63787 RepID=A0A7N0UWT9_KALFE